MGEIVSSWSILRPLPGSDKHFPRGQISFKFYSKNKCEKLVHLVGFIVRNKCLYYYYYYYSGPDKYLWLKFAHVGSAYPTLVPAGEYFMNWRFYPYVAHRNLLHCSLSQLLTLFLGRNMVERDHFEDLVVNGRIVLKWILDKLDEWAWNGFIWHRLVTSSVSL